MSTFSMYTAIFMIASALGATGSWGVQDWRYKAKEAAQILAVDGQKLQASAALAAQIAKTDAIQLALAATKNEQDITDAKRQKTNEALSARLRSAAAAGQLRDPRASGCGGGRSGTPVTAAANASAGTDDRADATGLLSADLTGLLLDQAKTADLVNSAYASCRADAQAVRQ